MTEFSEKVAIITDASSGIGRAIAEVMCHPGSPLGYPGSMVKLHRTLDPGSSPG
jgi:NADP-dependent 3-hydroxy acid dehydrogenase YdfG